MKKIYLSLCTIFLVSISLGQQSIKNTDFSDHTSKFNTYVISSEDESKAPPFWSDDLSDPSLWTMTDYAHSGTQNWVIGTAGPTGAYSSSMGAIASTTAANGFGLYDSDALSISYSNVQDATLAFNNPIDCSLYEYININFESNYRKFSDSIFVEVSNDNVNWDRYEVHADLSSNDGTANPEDVSINITSTASYQNSVWFRFRFEGVWDYAWMVDDVSFTETPDNAMTISEAVHGGWWVNYLTYGGDGYDYTFKPLSQLTSNPYSFEAVLSNDGIAPQNTTLHVEVSESGANVFSSSSNSVLLDMSFPRDTFVANNTFSPTSLGVYEMALWGTGDSVMSDTAILMSIVTENLYGRDWNNPSGSWRVGRPCGGMVLGLKYDMYADEDLYAIAVHIDDESIVGANMFAVLYESDPNGGDPIYLSQSDDYAITSADLGNWVTIPFDGSQQLFNGTAYVAAIGGYANPIDTFGVSVSGPSQGSCYIQDNGCDIGSQGFGFWYTTSSTPMIRMDFNPASLSTNDIDVNNFKIHPNPSNGVFIIEIDNIAGEDYYVISVKNILGQEVYISKEINSLNSQTIDLSDLEKGIYMLEISNPVTNISQKIIIQ